MDELLASAVPHLEIMAALQKIVDGAHLIGWESDESDFCTYLNPTAAALIDFESLGKWQIWAWLHLIHPEDAAEIHRTFSDARENLQEYQGEYRMLRSDGTVRWILGTAAPKFQNGSFLGYRGTLVDVTERHLAKLQLEHSEAKHRLLAENASDLLSHLAPDGSYIYASPSHLAVLGYSPEEVLKLDIRKLVHPDSLPALLALFRAETPAGCPIPADRPLQHTLHEVQAIHKDGHIVFLEVNVKFLKDAHTGHLQGLVAVSRDVTEQRKIQVELAKREERFRALTSLSSDWYWETDVDGHLTFVSEGVQQCLGISPEEMLGKNREQLSFQVGEAGMVSYVEHLRARSPFRDLLQTRASIQTGELRYICVSGEPVFENGQFLGYRGVSRDVTAAKHAEAMLLQLASYDHLTGLHNRMAMDKNLRGRLADNRTCNPLAIMAIDLDRFKEVNDSYGHETGDALLKEIAARIRGVTREGDLCARLGGDEFIMAAECRRGIGAASFLAKKLCAKLSEPMVINGHEVQVGASIGISMYPADGDTLEILYKKADTALYSVKEAGRNGFQFFSAEMSVDSRAKMKMQLDLRRALSLNQLEVHYQPRIDLRTNSVAGMEALLRWHHPLHGEVSPSRFIPIAEESGLIEEMGLWVLTEACEKAQEWIAEFKKPLRLSVNVSARQLRSKRLVYSVSEALRKSGLPAYCLELEITESSLMADVNLAVTILGELKSLGVRISVDDFGTGFSSLSYLRRFPLDSLKLDKSFLQDQADTVDPGRLATGIIGLAHSLNLTVVAEGVETEQHLTLLRRADCDEIQGFCVSTPLPAHEFKAFLTSGLAQSRVWGGRSAKSKRRPQAAGYSARRIKKRLGKLNTHAPR